MSFGLGPTGLGPTGLGGRGPGRTRSGGGADLSGADLSGADLSGADLSGADLSGADLSGADLSGAGLGRAGRRHRGAERTAPLVGELAAGQLVLGLLVKEQVLLGRLVHADGDHGQTREVLALALRLHAVVVFLCPVGMQFAPARNAVGHEPSFVVRAPRRRRVKPRFHVDRA
ncbi:MAG: pentapeptide repeat-containing protein [Streptosporangiaceae bacterium]